MINRYVALCLITSCVIACSCVDTRAQIQEHPYRTIVRYELDVARAINAGTVRRAYAELRALHQRTRATAAQDAFPFHAAAIERASSNTSAADRALRQFQHDRPTSPEIPFAWMERGFAAIEADDDAVAIDYFNQASQSAEEAATRHDRDAYIELAHAARFWQAVALAPIRSLV